MCAVGAYLARFTLGGVMPTEAAVAVARAPRRRRPGREVARRGRWRMWYPEREICVAVLALAVVLGAGGVAGTCEWSQLLLEDGGDREVEVNARHSFDVPPSDGGCTQGEPLGRRRLVPRGVKERGI